MLPIFRPPTLFHLAFDDVASAQIEDVGHVLGISICEAKALVANVVERCLNAGKFLTFVDVPFLVGLTSRDVPGHDFLELYVFALVSDESDIEVVEVLLGAPAGLSE